MQTVTVKSISITTVTIIITILFTLREFTASEVSQLNFSPPARREQLFGALLPSKRERKSSLCPVLAQSVAI